MHPILTYLWKVIQTSLVEIDLFQPYKDFYEICSGFSCRASVLQCFSCLQYHKVFSLIGFGRPWRLVCHWGPIVAEICAWRVFFSTTSSMQCLVLWGWNFWLGTSFCDQTILMPYHKYFFQGNAASQLWCPQCEVCCILRY